MTMPVFISYSQQDVAPYSSLCLAFDGAGITYWDPQAMEQGLALGSQLRKAIQECELCVFLATKRSLDSKWCSAEIGAFWGAGKRVIVYLADSEVSESQLPPQFQGDLWTRDARKVLSTIKSVMEMEERKRPPTAAEFRASCCKVIVTQNHNSIWSVVTGYLIDKKLVATLNYAAQSKELSEEMHVQFGQQVHRTVTEIHTDEELGTALLVLDSPLLEIPPLPLVEQCDTGVMCQGWGFPRAARGAGIPFNGEVVEANYTDDKGHLRILVSSPLVASSRPIGMEGCPLWAGGAVIGHLNSIFGDNGLFGLLVATPSSLVLQLLRRVRRQEA
jgi:hypothetical protein